MWRTDLRGIRQEPGKPGRDLQRQGKGLSSGRSQGRNGEEGSVRDWGWGLRDGRVKIRCSVLSSNAGRWWYHELSQRIRTGADFRGRRCPQFGSDSV